MPGSGPEEEPTLLRKVVSGVFVAALVLAVYYFIEWRTAPPPPPNIPLPEPTPEMMEEGWFPELPPLPGEQPAPPAATPPKATPPPERPVPEGAAPPR